MLRKVPLIVILGSTGTGKTKLSIELAERFGGEIISADSMQVYANLDVVTAKATKEERSKVPHHLLDVAKPSEPFTVVHFRNAAVPIIDDLLAKSKFPVVVGGTNYYIESLLWDILVGAPVSTSPPSSPDIKSSTFGHLNEHNEFDAIRNNLKELDFAKLTSESLHDHLKMVDPKSAQRIHPNNRRKIIRALEVYIQTGVPMTAILAEQRSQLGGNRLGGPLRYEHTVLFWLRCNQDILNDRLDRRVNNMLKDGLISEVRNFYDTHVGSGSENQFTKGVLQTIGFKEFIPYLEKYDSSHDSLIENFLRDNSYVIPNQIDKQHPEGLKTLSNCLEELKLVTKRYSKKQIKWINNRFLASKDRQVPAIYALDTSDVGAWESSVYSPAVDIIQSYMNNEQSEWKPLEKLQHPGVGLDEEISNFCEVCKRHFVGEFQYNLHLKSNKHKKVKEGQKKRDKNISSNCCTKG